MCKRIFKFELQLSSYWQNIKFSQYCPKFHIFTKIIIFHIMCNFLDQLLHPYKFHGRDMSGILFFIFASCEPLTQFERTHIHCRAIPWWRLWPKFENFSLLIDHSSYNKQAINHFVVAVRSTLGGQSTATPQKINLGQGQAQCPCNARWRLWLRTKVGSASESLQSPISVKCDRVLCQHLYIWWTTYC